VREGAADLKSRSALPDYYNRRGRTKLVREPSMDVGFGACALLN